MWGRTSTAGDVYFGQLKLSPIDLGEPGTYEVTYHVVMSCDGAACATADDSISVIVNEDTNNIVNKVDYSNIGNMGRWEKKSFQFSVGNPNIDVLIFDLFYWFILIFLISNSKIKMISKLTIRFRRLNKVSPVAYFVFDEMEIIRLKQSTGLPTMSSSTGIVLNIENY